MIENKDLIIHNNQITLDPSESEIRKSFMNVKKYLSILGENNIIDKNNQVHIYKLLTDLQSSILDIYNQEKGDLIKE